VLTLEKAIAECFDLVLSWLKGLELAIRAVKNPQVVRRHNQGFI
jgi:hypothetical protein